MNQNKTNQETILVVGASGTVGSELVRLLKVEGANVRTTTSREPKDTSSVKVNLSTGEGVSKAFEGVDKVFLLSPPGYADQHAILSPLIQEAKRRGLKKVVLMTAMGVNANDANPFRRAEIELEKSGLKYGIVRPNWFLQNFHTFWIQGIKQQGKILLPAGNAKVGFIDARDIASVVAKLLMTSKFDNQAFDLTGPESLDHTQVAGAISASTGKKISYQEISVEDFRSGLVGAGLPKDYAEVLVTIMGFLREGYNAGVTSSVQDITGRPPRSLGAYAVDYQAQWK